MAATLGYNDLKNVIRFPDTWDLAYLRAFNGRQGSQVDFGALVQEIGAAFTLFNAGLVAPANYWSDYLNTTSIPETEYVNGGSGDGLQMLGEYTRSDSIRGDSTGHMIPLADYGGAIGYTYWALRRGTLPKLRLPIQQLIIKAQTTWDRALLTRLFKMEADTVGATGKSVPFADGGASDPRYIPPSFNGNVFDNTHNHYLRLTADVAGFTAFLSGPTSAGEHLRHHGIMGPYILEISRTDLVAWSGLKYDVNGKGAQFRQPTRVMIQSIAVEVRAEIDETKYSGIIETSDGFIYYLHVVDRLPSGYAGVFKPYGKGNPNNPLLVRYEDGYPLGLTLVAQINHFPLEEAQGVFTFGAGVGNRVGGVLARFAANGNYVSPAIN